MKLKTFCSMTLLSALAAGTAPVSAELVAYDPFLSGDNRGAGEYTAGVDMRTMGAAAQGWVGTSGIDGFGVAHSGSTGNFQANATGESNALTDYEQGGRMQWLGTGNFPADRNLTRQLNPTPSSSTWYMSVMLNRLGWADSTTNTFVVGGFTDAAGNGLQVGYDDQVQNDFVPDLVIRLNDQNYIVTPNAASSDNQLMIVELTVNTAGNDVVRIWADPDSFSDLPDLVISDVNVTDSLTPFTQSKYESPGQSGPVYFDEVRLATTFDAVTNIPEPGSLALLGLGGLMLARRRR